MADPYFSELKYLGAKDLDFVEVAVDAGTDVTNLVVTVYNAGGGVRSSNAIFGLTPTTVGGKDVYVIDTGSSASFNGLGKSNAVSLSDSGTVYSFSSFDDTAGTVTASAGPASGLTSTDIGSAGLGSSLESNDGGASYGVQSSPTSGTVPCLTRGALVQTAQGAVAIENLTNGMQIRTRAGGFAPLRMAIRKKVSANDMRENPKLYPIRISAGAFGKGLPKRDLVVSRQHRMLVSSPIVRRMFGIDDVLIAAIKLTALPGIFVDTSLEAVEYFHLLFDTHQVIFAEDTPTESLFLGAETFKMLTAEIREELQALFPNLIAFGKLPASAALIPEGKQQKRLIERHVKNDMVVLKNFKTGNRDFQAVRV